MVAHIPPQFLYRYRGASNKYFAEELRRAINNREIYMSDLSKVNDPFEARPFLAANSPREVREYTASFERVYGKGISITGVDYNKISQELGIKKKKLLKAVGPSLEGANLTIGSLSSALQKHRRSLQIACFSERWDSLLMWGHYAQSHAGICIEYSPKIGIAAAEKIAPIAMEYSSTRPEISYLDLLEYMGSSRNANLQGFFDIERAERTFSKLAMTKPIEWEYELEWRVALARTSQAGYLRVACLEPTSILIGANCSPEIAALVRELAEDKVEIEVVSLDEKTFTLNRKCAAK
jgi:Protein of unknown function (DUF2971)